MIRLPTWLRQLGSPARRSARTTALAAALVVLGASPALAAPGLPRTYDAKQIDSPAPVNGGAFGWGVSSGDFTGDGEPDLLVGQSAQAQSVPSPSSGLVFLYDGVTGQLIETIAPPEKNPPATPDGPLPNDEIFGFVYVEKMPDIGSCPGGDGADANEICDAATIGGKDGIPEIITGTRTLRVDPANGALPGKPSDPAIGRAYVFDGATRAVLKRIDMPAVDRAHQASFTNPVAGPQYGRMTTSPQALPPCAGAVGEANNLGVGPCTDPGLAIRIGDVDGGGQPDVVIGVRNYLETGGAAGTAFPASQCRTSTAARCTGGRAYMYRGEQIAGTDPNTILETPLYTLKNPESQSTGSAEYGGNIYRVGDVGSCTVKPANFNPLLPERCTTTGGPDGRPEFVVAARNTDYPLKSPALPEFEDVGASYLYDGASGVLLNTFINPEPQSKSQFSGGYNGGLAPGDLGNTTLPDTAQAAPLFNADSTDDGKVWVFRGDVVGAGGGAEQSWQFASLTDPTPNIGESFGGGYTGVGDLVDGPSAPANELMVAGFGPFDPTTEASNSIIGDAHIFNPQSQRVLQTIPDPRQEQGSGFGVSMTPMGDLNDDGFLDFAVAAYLSDAQPNDLGGQGRVYIFTSDDSPPPPPPDPENPPAEASGPPQLLRAGDCTNRSMGTGQSETIRGTSAGDEIFAFAGDDTIESFQSGDCVDAGDGRDEVDGGDGADRLQGGGGNDSIQGREDRDRLFGGPGNDRLLGGFSRDFLAGGAGDDRLDGGKDIDRLFGETGDDRLAVGRGPIGRNYADGGAGDDRIDARNGRTDSVICGSGKDVVLTDGRDRIRTDCESIRSSRASRR